MKLFPYQEIGRDFLAGNTSCLLADEMRLGKAVMTVAAVDKIKSPLTLIVCRGVARGNWRKEFERWGQRRYAFDVVFSGGAGDVDLRPERLAEEPLVVITSYDLLENTLKRYGRYRFACSVLDESHACKEPTAKRTLVALGKNGLPKQTKRLWLLTGTPAPNNYAELFTTLRVLGRVHLSYWEFAKKFCHVHEGGFGPVVRGSNTSPAVVSELKALMAGKVLRREAKDVSIQLPKMSFSTVMVPPGRVELASTTFFKWVVPHDRTAELAKIIETELGIMNGILDKKTLSGEVLEVLKAEAKSISTLRRYTALQKLEPALNLIASELENKAYDKCVIFAHHKDCITTAQRFLHKFHPMTLYGGSNPLTVEKNLRRFQKPGHKCRVFIGQINAAGTSITLDAANHIFFLEESFVPGDNTQAAARCGGPNQTKPIFVRTFCLENSYDYRLQTILREKMSALAKLFGTLNDKPLTIEDLL